MTLRQLETIYAILRTGSITAADLRRESVISTGYGTRLGMLIEEGCLLHGHEPPAISIEASTSMAACQMVYCGAGLALVDRTSERNNGYGDLVFRRFSPRGGSAAPGPRRACGGPGRRPARFAAARQESAGKIRPGLRIPFGSRQCLSCRITAISCGVRVLPSHCRFWNPIPCSAETDPRTARVAS